MKKLAILLSFVFVLVVASQASAAVIEKGEKYRLNSGEVVAENLYVGSGEANIAGDVLGDLVVGGGNVILGGRNSKDVLVGGGSVNVFGTTGEDLRVAGGNVIIAGDVAGELAVLGGSVTVLSGVNVSGDAIVLGGSVTIDGTVGEDLMVMGGDVTLNGKVGGNVRVKQADRLTIGEAAEVAGDLAYRSPREAVIAEGAAIRGEVSYDQLTKRDYRKEARDGGLVAAFFGLFTLLALVKFLTILLAALLLIHLFKDGMRDVTDSVYGNFWRELLRGFVLLVTMPAAAIILGLTIVGSIPAVLIGLSYAALLVSASVYSGVFFGALLFKKFSKTKDLRLDWKSAVVGILVLGALGFVPLVGWLVDLAVMLAGMGGLANAAYKKVWM